MLNTKNKDFNNFNNKNTKHYQNVFKRRLWIRRFGKSNVTNSTQRKWNCWRTFDALNVLHHMLMTSEKLEFQIAASNCRKTNHAYYHFINPAIPNTRKEHCIQLSNDEDVSLPILRLRVDVENMYCKPIV